MGGQTLSKLRGSLITRPIQRFNIESRTEKLLKEEKPLRAPHYPSTEELVENIRRERPDIIEESSKKDTDLLKKLQNVYVSSNDPEFFDQDSNTKVNYDNPERPMPGKGIRSSPSYGFAEASQLKGSVIQGKITIDTAQLMMNEFARNPASDTLSLLAQNHQIPLQKLVHMLENFRVFHLYKDTSADGAINEENDPLRAKADWVSIEDSELSLKKSQETSPPIKSLPGKS